MASRILVVDDEVKITDVVGAYLARDGYEVEVAHDGRTALAAWQARPPALVVLDLMLPDMSGWDVCRRIRAAGPTPIIMLTARAGEEDRLEGLALGADDYVVKPFSPRELGGRIRAVLRRTHSLTPAADRLSLDGGALKIDIVDRTVRAGGRVVALTASEFAILAALARHPGRPYSRQELLDVMTGDEFDGSERVVDAHVKNLRRKIEPGPGAPRYIVTVHGIGYKLAGRGA